MGRGIGRTLFIAGVLAFGTAWSGAANASTITTYDLTLTPVPHTGTTLSGTGILELNGPVDPTGFEIFGFHNPNVLSLTITIDNITFDLTHSFAEIVFHNGKLIDISALGIDNKATLLVGLMGTAFFDKHIHAYDYVTAALTGPPQPPADETVTPLPATWSMMLVGFAVVGFVAYGGHKRRISAPA